MKISYKISIWMALFQALALVYAGYLLCNNVLLWSFNVSFFHNEWLVSFFNRLMVNHFCLLIGYSFLVLLLYAFFQIMGMQLENYLRIKNPNSDSIQYKISRFILPLSGRLLVEDKNTSEKRDLRYDILTTPLYFGLWVMPLLGFLGTIYGISGAISLLPQIKNDPSGMDNVLQNLHVAFDTTFLGLVAAICLGTILYALQISIKKIEYESLNSGD